MADADILIAWKDVEVEPERWGWTLALYAILHPDTNKILYIGKADGSTVRGRWQADDKLDRVWERMRDELGLDKHGFIVGEMITDWKLTRALVVDIECLLIFEVHKINPLLNEKCTKSRGKTSRPGMIVRCQGDWPLQRKTFRDE